MVDAAPMNLAEGLAREIARVTRLREQYLEAARLCGPGVNVAPAVFLMDQALEAAKRAAGLDDALAQLAAYRDLQGFEE